MASYTENLNLLKKNPLTEGNDNFNIDEMLNDNWDKIDAGVVTPILRVRLADTGTTVVATNGTKSVTLTESSGVWTGKLTDYGTWTITGTVGGSTTTKTIEVDTVKLYEVYLVPEDVNDASWSVISSVAQAGIADSVWDIGDTKSVTVNGTIGTYSVNKTLWVYIIGINHRGTSGITWQGFKTAQTGGVDVCLTDDNYGNSAYNGSKWFNMNHWGTNSGDYNTNYGGWKGSDLRYDILGSTRTAPSGYGSTATTSRVGYDAPTNTATSPVSNTLMAALPSALRAVMRPMTVYTDNKGNSSNTAANVTASVDYLPLLAEFEIHGTRSYANQYEQNQQSQYAYYAAGNSKVKHRDSATSTTAHWWTRSARYNTANTFCSVYTGGSAGNGYSGYSYGLAPAFLI